MRYFLYCRKSTESEDRQVMSIESQRGALEKSFGATGEVEIVAQFEESKSAKSPGRPIFAEMLTRIESGEAEGIVAWAPDRLARNSIDGGRLVYLLDCGVIRDLKFCTYTFENNSQGKFMLSIMFGQSKYYSDALSENVKRGNRTKVANGWRPNQAPLGYLNDPITRTIVKDPERFLQIRRMFELFLSGGFSVRQIARMARDDWGFRTPKRKRTGGKPLAVCSIYRILTNPFYAGVILWGGESHPGSHEPIVTPEEFEAAKTKLGRPRPDMPRPKCYTFAYAGLFRCGACGLMVTAEHKTKASGRRYLYYHCTRSRALQRCREPVIEVADLERQIVAFLRSLDVQPAIEDWVYDELEAEMASDEATAAAQIASIAKAKADIETQRVELTGLRLRGLLGDEEFAAARESLRQEELKLGAKAANAASGPISFEPVKNLIAFSKQAADWFERGDDDARRLILKTASSNRTLKDKILSIEAAKPFIAPPDLRGCRALRGVDDHVRTRAGKIRLNLRQHATRVANLLHDSEQYDDRINLHTLIERFQEPGPTHSIGDHRSRSPGRPQRPHIYPNAGDRSDACFPN